MARPKVTDEQRADEVCALVDRIVAETRGAAYATPGTPEAIAAWAMVAETSGQIQRRSRLLAGLGRGG